MTDNSTKDVYSDPLFSIPSFDTRLLDSVQNVSKIHFSEDCRSKWVVFKEYTYLADYRFTTEEGLIRAWVYLKSKKPFTDEEKALAYQRINESRTDLLHAVKEYRNSKAKEYTKGLPENSFDDLVTKLALQTKTSRAEVLQNAVNLYSAVLKCRDNFDHVYFKGTTPQDVSNKRWDQWCAQNPSAEECKMYDV